MFEREVFGCTGVGLLLSERERERWGPVPRLTSVVWDES